MTKRDEAILARARKEYDETRLQVRSFAAQVVDLDAKGSYYHVAEMAKYLLYAAIRANQLQYLLEGTYIDQKTYEVLT